MKIAVYPGSFDPVTNGHIDIIKRASCIFDKVIVAVLTNGSKNPYFTAQEKVEMIKIVSQDIPNVEVVHFYGLLVKLCEQTNANIVVKGLRAISDFEYEFQMALTNRQIGPQIETVFLPASPEHMYLSSTIVREVASLGGDISDFVSPLIKDRICGQLRR